MKVLVTTDGSERSLSALPHAAAFARATGSPLTLMRALDPLLDLGDYFALKVEEAVTLATADWEARLAVVLQRAGVEGEPLVVRKDDGEETWDAIIRAANARGVSLIAMDSRGAGAIRHALLGSVAMGLVGHTELPVMVSGPNIEPVAGNDGYHIIATTDGSPASLAVARALGPLVGNAGVKVTLLRLCWPGTAERGAEEIAAQMQTFRSHLPASARVTEDVREMAMVSGSAPAIIAVAQDLGAAAIAIATHGHSAAYHLFGGSTALGVVGQSPIPVILARSEQPPK